MTLTPARDLRNWKDIIKEMNVDDRAAVSFVTLVRTSNHGYQEACKILFHLLKDRKGLEHKSASSWLHNACSEALEALNSA